jgi:phage FluMu protein Com
MCGGLVPAEIILEKERFCKCENVPGVHIGEGFGDDLVYCDSCSKPLDPNKEIRNALEIVQDLEADGIKGSSKLVGPAAVKCYHCQEVSFGNSKADIDSLMRSLRKSKQFYCPKCRKVNKLSDKWEGMLK